LEITVGRNIILMFGTLVVLVIVAKFVIVVVAYIGLYTKSTQKISRLFFCIVHGIIQIALDCKEILLLVDIGSRAVGRVVSASFGGIILGIPLL